MSDALCTYGESEEQQSNVIWKALWQCQQLFCSYNYYCYADIAALCLGLEFCLDIIMVTDALYHPHGM